MLLLGLLAGTGSGAAVAEPQTDASVPVQAIADDAAVTLRQRLLQARARFEQRLDSQFDASDESSQTRQIRASAAPQILNLGLRAFTYADPDLDAAFRAAASALLKLLDPVWGGVYRGYEIPAVGSPGTVVPGKRLIDQAGALEVFARAYQHTGEVRFRNAIELIDAFLLETLATNRGTFYAGQLGRPERLPGNFGIDRYWALRTEHERRRFGVPGVDADVPPAANAAVARGYLAAHAATGEPNYLRVAVGATDALLGAAATGLAAQAQLSLALLELYSATGSERWLDAARRLLDGIGPMLQDRDRGDRAATVPAAIEPAESTAAAALIARAGYLLSVCMQQPGYGARARQTMLALAEAEAMPRRAEDIAVIATTLELLVAGSVEVIVAGPAGSETTQALLTQARAQYHPRKLVGYDFMQRFPHRAQPVVYICSPDLCTLPISAAEEIGPALLDFRAPASTLYP